MGYENFADATVCMDLIGLVLLLAPGGFFLNCRFWRHTFLLFSVK